LLNNMPNLIIRQNRIICPASITEPTSKFRVKRREENFGIPISVKRDNFTRADYLEWQISYFLGFDTIWDAYRKNKNPDIFDTLFGDYKRQELISSLKTAVEGKTEIRKRDFINDIETVFQENNETVITIPHKDNKKYLSYELADMFKLALEEGLVDEESIQELLSFNENNEFDIEANRRITRVATNETISDGFELWEEKAPVFIKTISDNTFVEIILKHKQKAVGYQSMVYFCSYADNVHDSNSKPIIGRRAEHHEIMYVPLTRGDLLGIAKSFMVASKKHAWDMRQVLQSIIQGQP